MRDGGAGVGSVRSRRGDTLSVEGRAREGRARPPDRQCSRRRAVTMSRLPALLVLAAVLLSVCAAPRSRRQLPEEDGLQPLQEQASEEQLREKRKLEGVTQAKFGVKNAILGFVFGKINSIIDAKTRLVETLDRQNIEKNKQYGIEAPANGLASLSGVVSGVVGPKLQLLGPKLQLVSGLFGGSSGAGGAGGSGSGLGSLLSLVTSLSGSSGGGAAASVDTVDSSEEEDS